MVLSVSAFGADNFVADGPNVRDEYLEAAEAARRDIAVFWTGKPLRGDWTYPCKVRVTGEGDSFEGVGKTNFSFDRGEVFNWSLQVQGPRQLIRDSVIPHEVHHTVVATEARRPIERWLDEGMAALFELPKDQARLRRQAQRYLDHPHTAFQRFDSREYPAGEHDVIVLYSTGFTLVEWLIKQRGTETLWNFVLDERKASDKFHSFYGMSVSSAWRQWRAWLRDRNPNSSALLQRQHIAMKEPSEADNGKPILYLFKTNTKYCPGCYNVTRDYSGNPEFRRELQKRYRIVQKDVQESRQLARSYGIEAVPAFCPTNSSKHVEGYNGASWLIAKLDSLPVDRAKQTLESAPPPPAEEESAPKPRTVKTSKSSTSNTTSFISGHKVSCRCAECFRQAFARIQSLERRIKILENRPTPEDGKDGKDGEPGEPGRGVAAVRVQSGDLQIRYTDSEEWVALGNVQGPPGEPGPSTDGRSVRSARVKNGNLEFRYSDSPEYVAVGPVRGPAGKPGRGVEAVRITNNGQLEIKYTDGESWFAVGHVRGADGPDPRVADLIDRIEKLEPLLRREVHMYIGNKLVDSLKGDEALKPSDAIPIYAVKRKKEKGTKEGSGN